MGVWIWKVDGMWDGEGGSWMEKGSAVMKGNHSCISDDMNLTVTRSTLRLCTILYTYQS